MSNRPMSLKLDPEKSDWDQEWSWVAHRDADPAEGSVAAALVKRRYDIEILGGITDDEASYSYDDWALCRLDGAYYLLSTSGCSCPSPSETWRVEIGPATLAEVRKHVLDGDYTGYTLPKRQMSDFIALLDAAEAA